MTNDNLKPSEGCLYQVNLLSFDYRLRYFKISTGFLYSQLMCLLWIKHEIFICFGQHVDFFFFFPTHLHGEWGEVSYVHQVWSIFLRVFLFTVTRGSFFAELVSLKATAIWIGAPICLTARSWQNLICCCALYCIWVFSLCFLSFWLLCCARKGRICFSWLLIFQEMCL